MTMKESYLRHALQSAAKKWRTKFKEMPANRLSEFLKDQPSYLAQFDEDKKYDPQFRALKSYQKVFKNFHRDMTHIVPEQKLDVEPMGLQGWKVMVEELIAHEESPPAFFMSEKFFTRLLETVSEVTEKIIEEDHFSQFYTHNTTCPYPFVLYYLPHSKTPILGVRTEYGSYYLWQAFLPKDEGGVIFLLDTKQDRVMNCTVKEDGISNLDLWTEKLPTPILDNEYLTNVFQETLHMVSLSSVAIKSPATDHLPVNSENRVMKLKDRKDEHKLYRVNLTNDQGGRRSPLFYVPRKEHDVRGHPRTYKSGKTIYIKDHKRGDASLGVITKDYLLDD